MFYLLFLEYNLVNITSGLTDGDEIYESFIINTVTVSAQYFIDLPS